MKISIITVCLNSEQYIERALDSLSYQSYQDYELIIVDGMSTDNTLNILNNYKYLITQLISEPDNGIYDAMNKGIKLATGDIVYFLNTDDYFCDKNVLNDVVKKFQLNENLDLLYGNVVYNINENYQKRTYRHVDKNTLIYESICHQGVFSKLDLFYKVGIFDTNYRLNADFDWLLKVFKSEATCNWYDRLIAVFNSSGTHNQDPILLSKEHRNVKKKYTNIYTLAIGHFYIRVKHRLYRHLTKKLLGHSNFNEGEFFDKRL